MNKLIHCFIALCCAFMLFTTGACSSKKQAKEQGKTGDITSAADTSTVNPSPSPSPTQLPVRYQNPGYVTGTDKDSEAFGDVKGEHQIKVGASIRSTIGPQPLWDVMKRLVNLKGMTVSWASDVDQNVTVDVDISASDNFYDAIANLLRQADYFHEINGKNIIVRNKTTKVYQIGIPAVKGGYTTTVGGNLLGGGASGTSSSTVSSGSSGGSAQSGVEGTVKVVSADNKFNVWEDMENNLKNILQTGEAERKDIASSVPSPTATPKDQATKNDKDESSAPMHKGVNYTAKDSASFVIDKSIGSVTVTAKPSLLKNVDNYINNLKKHLYQQVSIEAKIIEVYLADNSKIGLDWSSVLKDFNVSAVVGFGTAGQVYPHTSSDPSQYASTFVSRVVIPPLRFDVLMNALSEQGDTQVLSNPKLTVLNGQPAIISVGKDIAYVKSVTKDVSNNSGGNNTDSYSVLTGNVVSGVSLGVMASILDKGRVVMHLTPIITNVSNLNSNGDVPTTEVAPGIKLGLPQVQVREMSTMVEVGSGEMLIIGGLIDTADGTTGKFAPGLGSIPGLRYLFGVEEKTKTKRELVVLLTPKII